MKKDSRQKGSEFEERFEKFFTGLLEHLGFKPVKIRRQHSGFQFGRDLHFKWSTTNGEEVSWFFQCKAWDASPINSGEILKDLEWATRSAHRIDYWVLVAPYQDITDEADELIEAKRNSYSFEILLWTPEYDIRDLSKVDSRFYQAVYDDKPYLRKNEKSHLLEIWRRKLDSKPKSATAIAEPKAHVTVETAFYNTKVNKPQFNLTIANIGNTDIVVSNAYLHYLTAEVSSSRRNFEHLTASMMRTFRTPISFALNDIENKKTFFTPSGKGRFLLYSEDMTEQSIVLAPGEYQLLSMRVEFGDYIFGLLTPVFDCIDPISGKHARCSCQKIFLISRPDDSSWWQPQSPSIEGLRTEILTVDDMLVHATELTRQKLSSDSEDFWNLSDEPRFMKNYAEAIEHLEEASRNLIGMLESSDPIRRMTVLEITSHFKSKEELPQILGMCLNDDDVGVRARVLLVAEYASASEKRESGLEKRLQQYTALGTLEEKALAPTLLEAIKQYPWFANRATVEAIKKFAGESVAISLLVEELKNSEAEIRRRMVRSIGMFLRLKDSSGANLLVPMLEDPDAKVRVETINALEWIGDESTFSHIASLYKDEDRQVRLETVDAIGLHKYTQGIPALIALLEDGDVDVRARAALQLGFLHASTALESLLKAATDEHDIVRENSIIALGYIGDQRAIPLLLRALKDDDAKVRGQAVDALRKIGAIEAVPQLMEIANDSDSSVRFHTLLAFLEFKAALTLPLFRRALNDPYDLVRSEGIKGIAEFGQESDINLLLNYAKKLPEHSFEKSEILQATEKIKKRLLNHP